MANQQNNPTKPGMSNQQPGSKPQGQGQSSQYRDDTERKGEPQRSQPSQQGNR